MTLGSLWPCDAGPPQSLDRPASGGFVFSAASNHKASPGTNAAHAAFAQGKVRGRPTIGTSLWFVVRMRDLRGQHSWSESPKAAIHALRPCLRWHRVVFGTTVTARKAVAVEPSALPDPMPQEAAVPGSGSRGEEPLAILGGRARSGTGGACVAR